MQLVDLHCHILPGIDDGAKDIDVSMQLLQQEMRDDVVGICFTPHFYYERNTVEAFVANRKQAFSAVTDQIKRNGFRIAVKTGAEVYFTPALPSLNLKKLAFYGTNYILIELPTTFHPSGIEDVLYEVQQQGYTPILAHVERYPYVTENPGLLYDWVSSGSLAQINASGLIRNGHTAKLLQKYIDWNMVHLLCTDAHHPEKRPAQLGAAFSTLPTSVQKHFQKNAIDIFLGNDVHPPEPVQPRYRFGHWR
ncbi:MAG TPA: capsular biosynthesis protein [Subdoligranulum variabile]|uniref:protein-tyrosine-phosphatase n=1 Tax=Subdoligranulum variabile TaxID=214851 RepID=A0A921ILA3_9FIRM|nr:capsular biosynthesis protein [Subdoligranulum variabile]